MIRKLAWCLLVLSIIGLIAGALDLQLPTLRWPFNVGREMGIETLRAPDLTKITTEELTEAANAGNEVPMKTSPWRVIGYAFYHAFGYVFWGANVIVAVLFLLKFKRGFKFTPITERRLKRFREIRRGYVAFLILCLLALVASLDHVLVGNEALVVRYNGQWYFPAFVGDKEKPKGELFGLEGDAALTNPNYRKLKKSFIADDSENWMIMPVIPYAPTGDTISNQIEPLEVDDQGVIYFEGGREKFSGIAIRLYDESDTNRMHTRMQVRDGVATNDVTGWSEDGERVFTANYRDGELAQKVWLGKGTFEEFMERGRSLELFQAHLNPVRPLPENGHFLGTTSQGYDVLAYLFGGLQVNFKAAVFYIPIVYFIGISIGLLMGYFGGAFDLIVQRLIEVFSTIPFLFVIMIASSSVPDQLKGLGPILVILLTFSWMGMTYLMRTAALKEKARDYVASARVIGAPTHTILFRHILPNAVAIIVTLVPFSVSGLVMSLTSLDYLGFGLPPEYATWGRLLQDGLDNLSSPWLATSAFLALVSLLILVTFVGEAVREAFDPKKYTTYR